MTTSTPATHPADVEDMRARVDAALADFLDQQEKRFDTLVADADSRQEWHRVLESLRAFLLGGKRLRAAFCYWGWRGAGGDPEEPGIITAAAALELLHAFALIHDDIIDESDTRRGAPSLHHQHAAQHRRLDRRGCAESFGVSVALLLGDLCLGWFHEMLGNSGLPAKRLTTARELVSRGFTELVMGQYLDLAEQSRSADSVDSSLSVDRACTIIRYKTSKYTIERPLHLGGILAGAEPELLDSFSAYALPLGEAFQLRDDVLGAFGDPVVTGKPVADDLRARKATLLVATAHRLSAPRDAEEIDHLFAGADLTDEQVHRLQSIVVHSGALAESERRIDERAETATGVLHAMPIDETARDVLGSLIVAATDRTR